jgi:hypothetical protein
VVTGVPAHQQLLLFAGQVLCPDSALLLDHLGLDKFSLAHEVRCRHCRDVTARLGSKQ